MAKYRAKYCERTQHSTQDKQIEANALTDVARYIMMASLLMRAFKIFILDWLHYAGA